MHLCRSARYCLLVAVLCFSSLVAGCQGAKPTSVDAVSNVAPIVETSTPAPTRTLAEFPSTRTPTPRGLNIDPTRTASPTPTATFNLPQTMSAKATNDKATDCKKYPDTWEIKVTPHWEPGWCLINTLGGKFYEYSLIYPGSWMVGTFGDVFPNLAFNTGQQEVELRLYQVYKYATRKYEGALEDVPMKASFCDTDDKCTLVVNPNETIANKEARSVGGKKVFIVDSQDGKYNIRRYFFFVPFKYVSPKSNRLFFFKLYTPDPFSSSTYSDIEQKIERMITSIKEDR